MSASVEPLLWIMIAALFLIVAVAIFALQNRSNSDSSVSMQLFPPRFVSNAKASNSEEKKSNNKGKRKKRKKKSARRKKK